MEKQNETRKRTMDNLKGIITEGKVELRKCDDCKKWWSVIRLCTNGSTLKRECPDCYKSDTLLIDVSKDYSELITSDFADLEARCFATKGYVCDACGEDCPIIFPIEVEGKEIGTCENCYEEIEEELGGS